MNKKRVIIGDVHGRFGYLQAIIEKESPADFIVLGDYLDSFDIHPDDCLECLKKTIELKKSYTQGSMILLLGNHDAHYLSDWPDCGSGWNLSISWDAGEILERAISGKLIQKIYVDEASKTIYSHAGVSYTWYNNQCGTDEEEFSLEDINDLPSKAFRFVGANMYGDDPRNGPLWIRPGSLSVDPWKTPDGEVWTQVVGHTESMSPMDIDLCGDKTAYLYIMDCIGTHYLVETLNDSGVVIKRKITKNDITR